VIVQEKSLKVLKCYNCLRVQRRQNCSPAASFTNCVMTLYLLRVHLQTFLSISITQKCQSLSCDILVANELYIHIYICKMLLNFLRTFRGCELGTSGSSFRQGTCVSETSFIVISTSRRRPEVRQPARADLEMGIFNYLFHFRICLYVYIVRVTFNCIVSIISSELFEVAAADFLACNCSDAPCSEALSRKAITYSE